MKIPEDPIFTFRTDRERRAHRVARIVQNILFAIGFIGLFASIYFSVIGGGR